MKNRKFVSSLIALAILLKTFGFFNQYFAQGRELLASVITCQEPVLEFFIACQMPMKIVESIMKNISSEAENKASKEPKNQKKGNTSAEFSILPVTKIKASAFAKTSLQVAKTMHIWSPALFLFTNFYAHKGKGEVPLIGSFILDFLVVLSLCSLPAITKKSLAANYISPAFIKPGLFCFMEERCN